MMAIPTIQNPQILRETMQYFIQHSDMNVRKWAQHKNREWVLSGLNATRSRIAQSFFMRIQRVGNQTEVTHAKSNRATGTNLELSTAIQR